MYSVPKALEEIRQIYDDLYSCNIIWVTHGAVQLFLGKWKKTSYDHVTNDTLERQKIMVL